jgi:predicted NAD/FAD-dependent oxidoreductase
VTVYDKGRGPGGRISSRRREGFAFDHGAQYFTARSPLFKRVVNAWLAAGVIEPWPARLVAFDGRSPREVGREDTRYVGTPNMNAVAKHLARDLDIHSRVRIVDIRLRGARWELDDGDGDLREADVVLVTTPPEQAAPLLAAAPHLAAAAAGANMEPTWACLVVFAAPPAVEFDGAFVNADPTSAGDPALAWVARNASKPGRGSAEAWVLHASAAWSFENLELDEDEAGARLVDAFVELIGRSAPRIVYRDAHRWRYAQPAAALDVRCLYDDSLRIGAAGDWCGGPRVEGAFLSGAALADRVLGRADEGSGRTETRAASG